MNQHRGQSKYRQWQPGAVVGTVHTRAGLAAARRPTAAMLDFVEIRLDLLPSIPAPGALREIPHPLILTARHAAEGGGRNWTPEERAAVLQPLLASAAAVDLELSRAGFSRELLAQLNRRSIPAIFSFHDFAGTPSARRLLALRDRAARGGAAVFKVATALRGPADLIPLLQLLRDPPLPVAAMGMGALGQPSRLLLAAAGSVLNYGWLHRPQVPGQPSALRLAKLLREFAAA